MAASIKYQHNTLLAPLNCVKVSAREALKRLAVLIGLVCLGMLLLPISLLPASAQETDSGDQIPSQETPIHIKADQLITDTRKNTAEFRGNVRATQGETVITSAMLTVHYRSGARADAATGMDAIVRIVAEGNVEIVFDQQTAHTQHAEYIAENRLIILTGAGSKIVSGKNTITGQKITFHRDDGRVQVVGSADAPVEAFFYSNDTGLATPANPDPN